MVETRKKSALERYFWPILAVGVVVVVAVIVGLFKVTADDYQQTRTELNKNYVEKIDVQSSGGRGRSKLIIIDGTPRYDCSEKDGRLSCSHGPQPTLAR